MRHSPWILAQFLNDTKESNFWNRKTLIKTAQPNQWSNTERLGIEQVRTSNLMDRLKFKQWSFKRIENCDKNGERGKKNRPENHSWLIMTGFFYLLTAHIEMEPSLLQLSPGHHRDAKRQIWVLMELFCYHRRRRRSFPFVHSCWESREALILIY